MSSTLLTYSNPRIVFNSEKNHINTIEVLLTDQIGSNQLTKSLKFDKIIFIRFADPCPEMLNVLYPVSVISDIVGFLCGDVQPIFLANSGSISSFVLKPFPLYPALHVQVKAVSVSEQKAFS